MRAYDNVPVSPVCVNDSLAIDSDYCGIFATALNDITNKYRSTPQDPVVRSCSSASIATVAPRPDADATYRFFFVQDKQFQSFLAGRFTMSSVVASLQLQLAETARIPASRIQIISFTNQGVVDTLILERSRGSEPHTADLLVEIDTVISAPFLFNYSGRTLTTIIPGTQNTADAGDSSTEDSDSTNTAMIVVVSILIVIIVIAALYMYIRDIKKQKESSVTSNEEPVQMIDIDGKPYWRDDTERGASDVNIEESVIDDMTNPRRTTLEYHNPIAYRAAASVAKPEGLGGFDYIVRSIRPVMPFTFPTAFPVAQLANRPKEAQSREFNEVCNLSSGYQTTNIGHKFLDDYNLPRGLVSSNNVVPWDIVWQSDSTVVVLLPSSDESDILLPKSGNSINSDDILVTTSKTEKLTEDLFCHTLSLTNQLSGEERVVQSLQMSSWNEQSIEQDLIDLLIAAKQSHYANECAPAVVFDNGGSGRPSSGAFILAWISVKSALDSGFMDLARTTLLLRAQEKDLVRDLDEYMFVHSTLQRMLLTIPSMPEVQMTQSQHLAKMCLQTWHSTMKAQLRGESSSGYIDIAAVPDMPQDSGLPGQVQTTIPSSRQGDALAQYPDFPGFQG